MVPIIISSLLNKEGGSKTFLPLKIIILLFLIVVLFIPWLFGKIFVKERNYAINVNAAQSGCWSEVTAPSCACAAVNCSCGCGCGCGSCGGAAACTAGASGGFGGADGGE